MSKRQRNRELRAVRDIQASNAAMLAKVLEFIPRIPSLIAAIEQKWMECGSEVRAIAERWKQRNRERQV